MSTSSAELKLLCSGRPEPALWGGIECTINRTRSGFRDQLEETGHYARGDDIQAIASLGITALRYPLLWEKMQPEPGTAIDWAWADKQLKAITRQGITPIAGLLHHGSGPDWTSLADTAFPEQLAAYAAQVALRYPWIQYYTPVNEPLTTARFSGLYGHWYPHAKSDRDFIKMLLHQLKATVLAMREIRKINPAAVLVQTEDLSKTHSTPALAPQAAFENERRWLTWDLLCGSVTPKHVLWNYLLDTGVQEEALQFFIDNPCPPGIIGCNYYVTSERWLDEHTELYPPVTHGGNGIIAYADTECVRIQQPAGLEALLTEAWERYGIALAVTEVHLHCTREEQLRWLGEAWATACRLRQQGVDVKAITAWALLGSYDWCSLITRKENRYEPGAFTITAAGLRSTALAGMIRSLSKTGAYHHPLLQAKGWWHSGKKIAAANTPPLLILGEEGLCSLLLAVCAKRSIACLSVSFTKDSPPSAIRAGIGEQHPWGIIYATQGRPSVRLLQLLEEAGNDTGTSWMHIEPRIYFDGHLSVPGIGLSIVVPGSAITDTLYNEGAAWYEDIHDEERSTAAWSPMLDSALDLFIDCSPGSWEITPYATRAATPVAGEAQQNI